MKTILSILAIILLLSLVLNGYLVWDKRQAQKERLADNSRLNKVIEDQTIYIATIDSGIDYMFREARRDSIKYAKKDSVLNAKISRLTSKLRLIDTSKSTDKQLDSLINLLYGDTQPSH